MEVDHTGAVVSEQAAGVAGAWIEFHFQAAWD